MIPDNFIFVITPEPKPLLTATCENCGWRNEANLAAKDTFLHALTVHNWHFCKGSAA